MMFWNSGNEVSNTSIFPAKEIFVLSDSNPASVTQSQVNSVTKQIPITFNRIAISAVSIPPSANTLWIPDSVPGRFLSKLRMMIAPAETDNSIALCGLWDRSIAAKTAVTIAAPQIVIMFMLQPEGVLDGREQLADL